MVWLLHNSEKRCEHGSECGGERWQGNGEALVCGGKDIDDARTNGLVEPQWLMTRLLAVVMCKGERTTCNREHDDARLHRKLYGTTPRLDGGCVVVEVLGALTYEEKLDFFTG